MAAELTAELEALHEAIDGLATLNPAALDEGSLDTLVVALQRERARLGSVAARLIGSWDARRVWASDGSRSAAARLARDTSCSASTAAVELRRARSRPAVPATAAAVERGELSLDHLDLLGRACQPHRAAVFVRDEATLVDHCARLRYADAVRVVGYWCRRADADADHDGAPPEDRAHLQVSPTTGGVVVNGVLDPIGGAIFRDELRRLERELYLVDERDGVDRAAAQRRAAALVTMAQRSGAAVGGRRSRRPLFSVLVGEGTLSELCELAGETVIEPRQLAPWLGTAELETILFDGPSTVLSVSRRRSFTGAVRRAIEVRDRHCQHPSGCDVPAAECDVDHIVPYRDGGPTSQHNGRLECPPHNRHTDRHDQEAPPYPARSVTRLDELRARIRWRVVHDDRLADHNDDDDHNDHTDHTDPAAQADDPPTHGVVVLAACADRRPPPNPRDSRGANHGCPQPPRGSAPPLASSIIASYGFVITCVGYGACSEPGCHCRVRERYPWTYTVGLTDAGLPELVLMGLDPVPAHHAVNWVAEEGRAGRALPVEQPFVLDGVRVKLLAVPDEWVLTDSSRMAAWFAHYRRSAARGTLPDIQQVVWADADGRFPDDPGCADSVVREQPILLSAPFTYPKPSPDPRHRHRPRSAPRR